MASETGVLDKVIIDADTEKNIIEQFIWWKTGDKIDDIQTKKLGIVFLKFNSIEEMLEKTEKMQTLIHAKLH